MPMNLALVIFELVVMLLAIAIHDCAQAWMADRLGDATARLSGRLTLNPVPHFDFFGTALWPLIYIWRSPLVLAWGKPVPMISRNFRHPKDEIKAVIAGPVAQFFAAILCLVALVIVKHMSPTAGPSLGIAAALSMRNLDVPTPATPLFPLLLFFYFGILMNLLLCVFNLVPLPFLDGGKILVYYLPPNAARAYERWGLWLMFGFMFFGFGIILAIFLPLLTYFNRLLFAL